MTQRQIIGNLGVEISRVANFYERGSLQNAERFILLALELLEKVDVGKLNPTVRDIISKTDILMKSNNPQQIMEKGPILGKILLDYYTTSIS